MIGPDGFDDGFVPEFRFTPRPVDVTLENFKTADIPEVIGLEQEDRLIVCDCPHCGEFEFRVEAGLNFCEKQGMDASFFLIVVPYTEAE